MERIPHKWHTMHWAIRTFHNLPRKNFITFLCKEFMVIALCFPPRCTVPVFLGHFSLQLPTERPRSRSSAERDLRTDLTVGFFKGSNFWPSSAPHSVITGNHG